jgi:hypothetical protein
LEEEKEVTLEGEMLQDKWQTSDSVLVELFQMQETMQELIPIGLFDLGDVGADSKTLEHTTRLRKRVSMLFVAFVVSCLFGGPLATVLCVPICVLRSVHDAIPTPISAPVSVMVLFFCVVTCPVGFFVLSPLPFALLFLFCVLDARYKLRSYRTTSLFIRMASQSIVSVFSYFDKPGLLSVLTTSGIAVDPCHNLLESVREGTSLLRGYSKSLHSLKVSHYLRGICGVMGLCLSVVLLDIWLFAFSGFMLSDFVSLQVQLLRFCRTPQLMPLELVESWDSRPKYWAIGSVFAWVPIALLDIFLVALLSWQSYFIYGPDLLIVFAIRAVPLVVARYICAWIQLRCQILCRNTGNRRAALHTGLLLAINTKALDASEDRSQRGRLLLRHEKAQAERGERVSKSYLSIPEYFFLRTAIRKGVKL